MFPYLIIYFVVVEIQPFEDFVDELVLSYLLPQVCCICFCLILRLSLNLNPILIWANITFVLILKVLMNLIF